MLGANKDAFLISVLLLMSVALLVVLAFAWLLPRFHFRFGILFTVAAVLAAAASIWLVDVNVPLQDSHWRPGSASVSIPVALLAWAARVAAVSSIAMSTRRSRRGA